MRKPSFVLAALTVLLLLGGDVVSGDAAASLFGTPRAPAAGCQFLSTTGATAAFCDSLATGVHSGGRAGDLDGSLWSVSRYASSDNSNSTLMRFPNTPASACKAGVTTVTADSDILACDAASGHLGQFETTMSAQPYALISMRPRHPFDFTGRTGTISFNVDVLTAGNLSWFPSLFLTDDPNPGADNTSHSNGLIPRNGAGFSFDDQCNSPSAMARVNTLYTFAIYNQTAVPLTSTACIQTQRGSLNHIEVRVSQTNWQIWASDFSTDGGATFPNFRLVGQAAISLPFSTGYVHYQQEERAPLKYSYSPGYTQNYWSNLGFDGPVLAGDTGYAVPDALTPNSLGGVNIGYGLFNSPNSMFTCCPQTTVPSFSLPGVNLSGVTAAKLTFAIFYTFGDGVHTPSTLSAQYRFNGGPLHSPSPAPDYSKAFYCPDCPFPPGNSANWSVAYSFPVAVSELVSGTNTLEILSNGSMNSYPAILSNVELLTSGGVVAAGTTPTPTATPTATSTATATATASATGTATATTPATMTCRVSVELNGTPGPYRPC